MKTFYLLLLVALTTFTLQSQNLYIQSGTCVTEKSGTQLNFTNGSNLVIRDNPSTAPSFLQEGLVNFSGGGTALVEQYLTKDTWNMVSSPVSNGIIGAYEWMYLYYYQESDNTWHYLNKPVTQSLNAGQGYFVWPYNEDPNGTYPASPDSAVIKGNLNYQDIDLVLSNTASSPKSGWNLVGNPFPVALHWNGDASWNLSNVGAAMYIMDPVSGNYVVWNYNTGGSNANGGYIAATQGFWVRVADTTGTAASMTLPASQRSHNSASFYKSEGAVLPQQLLVTVDNGTKNDKSVIGFLQNASAGFDPGYDAAYLAGGTESPALYSLTGNAKYALNELPSLEDFPVVPLGFEPKTSGSFTLSADWMESFANDVPIFLEDIKDNTFHDLRALPAYTFTASNDDNLIRFNIHFTNPLGVGENPADWINVYAYREIVYVNFPENVRGDIYIFNTLGEQITSRSHAEGKVSIPVQAAQSVILVKVVTGKDVLSKKLTIR